MSSKFLPAFIDGARYLNQELAPRVRTRTATPDEILTFCRNHRIAAIGELLLHGDADAFRLHLCKSGRALLHFLEGEGGAPLLLSRTTPFFDAVAAGDLEGARGIAHRAARTWAQGREYEEDFLYMNFLMGHFFREASNAHTEALLQRHEQVLHGTDDVRLNVCRALMTRQGSDFDAALERMMNERDARQTRLRAKGSLDEETWATECQVSIEGLALVALAEHAGMTVSQNQLFIPSLAREGAIPGEPSDLR